MPNRETERYYKLMQQRHAAHKHLIELLRDDRRFKEEMEELFPDVDWEWIGRQQEAE